VDRDDELAELIRTAWACEDLALHYTRFTQTPAKMSLTSLCLYSVKMIVTTMTTVHPRPTMTPVHLLPLSVRSSIGAAHRSACVCLPHIPQTVEMQVEIQLTSGEL
jgi:hypothetical protein